MELPQIEIQKILFATDLSENARYAFAYAASLANRYGASLVILHVLAELPSLDTSISYYIGKAEWESIKQKRMRVAQEKLIGKKRSDLAIRDALNRFFEQAQVGTEDRNLLRDETIVERGDPARQILKYAEERKCDLIVMGRHGHGSLADAVMGSTTKYVLQRSKIPVLVVRLPDKP
jgi:nucleotide-binding universal stress UspA family protein